jgi:hypothetical protein
MENSPDDPEKPIGHARLTTPLSLIALLAILLITTTALFSPVLLLGNSLEGTDQVSTNSLQENQVDGRWCGNSSEDAISRGCHMEVVPRPIRRSHPKLLF